jgi:hypothetical protein
MGDIEIHTADGWVKLQDLIIGQETCSKCGDQGEAESIGYQKCDPPELLIWFCKECR